jgi:hypothetical protein
VRAHGEIPSAVNLPGRSVFNRVSCWLLRLPAAVRDISDEARHEYILLPGVLGLTMVVDIESGGVPACYVHASGFVTGGSSEVMRRRHRWRKTECSGGPGRTV